MVGRVAFAGVLGLMMLIVALRPTPALAQVRYQCRDGVTVLVNYGGQHAELTFLGIRYFLPQVPLGEGSRYSDGRFTWTLSRGQEGTLTHDGAVIARDCRTGSSIVQPQPGGATYVCAGGGTVTATYGGATALVTFQGTSYRLLQVPLAEGSRYTNGRLTWTLTRGQEGTLTQDGAVIARDCRTSGLVSQSGATTYTCASGGTVVAAYSGSIVTLTFDGSTHRLVQIPLADGSRYTDGRLTWTVTRGNEGTLTRFGSVLARDCRTDTFQPREPER